MANSNYKSSVNKKVQSRVKRKIKRKVRKSPIIIVILLIVALAGFLLYNYGEEWFGISFDTGKQTISGTVPTPADGEILFHFIDVGQGDAILITTKSGNMLIDTSESGERDALVNYLDKAGIKAFKYVIFTHTDADHIGSADYVMKNYDVENVILPNYVATTKTYERMMDAIEESNAKLILVGKGENCVEAGYTFLLGSLKNTIIAPAENYDDPNEMSIVLKSTYGDTSIMFTGDAEEKSEEDILKLWSKADLDCDVLKAGHHGSSSSSTQAFLDAITPDIAVISCGKDNSYGHPHTEVLERFNKAGIEVYRTDTQGTIVLKTDGNRFVYVGENN